MLGEGIDKPGSLAEKAEAAFNESNKRSLAVKTKSTLMPVDEQGEQEADAVLSTSNSNFAEDKPMRQRTFAPQISSIEEIEMSDIIDDVFLESTSGFRPAPGPMHEPGGQRVPQSGDAGTGWSLHVEEQPTPQPAASDNNDGGRRWYKPSTWQRSKPAGTPANNAGNGNHVEVTQISGFGNDRAGLATPDSDDGPVWAGAGGGRQRPRRAAARVSPAPRPDAAFDVMECPGAINDGPVADAPPDDKIRRNDRVRTPLEEDRHPPHGQGFGVAPAASRVHTEDMVEGFSEPTREFGHKPDRKVRHFTPEASGGREAAPVGQSAPSWNLQVEEPKPREEPEPREDPVRKRFWKPWGASKQQAATPAATVEQTMVCAFGND